MKAVKLGSLALLLAIPLAVPAISSAADLGKLYRGDHRMQQSTISSLTRDEIRLAGMRMFATPLLKSDGFGDGNDANPTGAQTQRGTLQGNGTFQRIGGLDGQMCLECHSIISRREVPMRFGIGGVAGVNGTVLGAGGNTYVDLDLSDESGGDSQKNIDGRVINPPFIFGAGGIELLANEMTTELREQIANARNRKTTQLSANGISFGSITKDANGNIDVDGKGNAIGAEGTFVLDPANENFMVVAPFGRKGDAKSTRDFDIGAFSFHFGMGVVTSAEDAEVVLDAYGAEVAVTQDTDHDEDGVHNEVTEGELSVLSAFVATAQTPFQVSVNRNAKRGGSLMDSIGCTGCHVPSMKTKSSTLGLRFPEVANDPAANVYVELDMTEAPMSFEKTRQGGITVPLFADLKRHYMGPSLEEFNEDGMFTTMRLWGVADTAPYLHDGRALTITDAIVLHGADATSEANPAVSNFNALSAEDKDAVLAFLDTLRSPDGTFPDLMELSDVVAAEQGVN